MLGLGGNSLALHFNQQSDFILAHNELNYSRTILIPFCSTSCCKLHALSFPNY